MTLPLLRRRASGSNALAGAIGLLIGLGFLVWTILGRVNRESDTVRDILRDQGHLPVKSVKLADNGTGTAKLDDGSTVDLLYRTSQEAGGKRIECIYRAPEAVAKAQISGLATQIGFTPKLVEIHPTHNGLGYVGRVVAESGEILTVAEHTDHAKFQTLQSVVLASESYPTHVKNSLTKEFGEAASDVESVPAPSAPLFGIEADVVPTKRYHYAARLASGRMFRVVLIETTPPTLDGSGPSLPRVELRYQELPKG